MQNLKLPNYVKYWTICIIFDIIKNMIEPKEIVRTNRKSLALTINEKGELIVHAPKYMPLYEIVNFIEKKEDWITKKSESINSLLNRNKDIVNYNEIFFLGKRYKVIETKGVENPFITKDTILIEICKTNAKKQKLLKEWYMQNVESILMPRVQRLTEFMKQKYKSVKIINSKAKWGMCDSKKNLYFNWKLLMLSPEIIDYVIIHETSHLIELNHSPKFWEIVGAVLPKYKHYKQVINKCGFLIKLY